MNEPMKRFIQRLRTTNATRITGHLHDIGTECFCVGGLMCDSYIQETGVGQWRRDNTGATYFWLFDDYDSYSTVLIDVQNHFGLTSNDIARCYALNDTDQLTFPQMADKLEALLNESANT